MIVFPVLLFLFLVLLLPLVITGFTLDIVQVAVVKLGFAPQLAVLLLVAIVIGSAINIPLYQREIQPAGMPWLMESARRRTLVALNVGGGLIPIILAIYQLTRGHILAILTTTAIVTLISYFSAEIVPGNGIRMNAMVAPLTAVICAWLLGADAAPQVAFAGGILGTLIGADLLHLREVEHLASGILSIGGAGVFDGIALCGLFALLLA
ncbi:membrane protein [Leptolyngbya sp. Heron Island J]|uniref:DUF1614 domain-containing protein n=1 Tax=Leptolyngbya sp. Heron Island J TaxID=1385935 RepID=UPI0003B9968E|nr:DUF1614 domain-containing protein [Leptolyngbya sp. Heron Island J]ESA38372.1 membrane protein [Leptolyngbya sp. Heron Island J]